jgi:hypothetical protein
MAKDYSPSNLNELNFWFYLNRFADIAENYFTNGYEYSYLKATAADWPNFIYRVKLNDNNPDNLFSHLAENIKTGNLPSFFSIGPGSDPDEIAEILYSGPFQFIEMWPGMFYDNNNGTKLKEKEIKDFKIIEVNNSVSMDSWLSIIKSEFFPKQVIPNAIFRDLLNDKRFKLFLGIYNDIPVATSMSVNDGHSIGLYMISTQKEYRKSGIGYNMTIKPINESIDLESDLPFVLQATNAGINVYEGIGFREVCNYFILRKNDN